MYDFGLDGFRPVWAKDRGQAAERHGEVLAAVVGRRLAGTWVGWPIGSSRRFLGLPLVLDFGGDRVEVLHEPCWGVSVTANTVDLEAPIEGRAGGTEPAFHVGAGGWTSVMC